MLLRRIHFTAAAHTVPWNRLRRYGPTSSRCDPQPPPAGIGDAAVIYAAGSADTAIADVFRLSRTVVTGLDGPHLLAFTLGRPVTLLDLSSVWPTRAVASQPISSGPRTRASRWARAISQQFDVDGVRYPSSMFGRGECVAVWTRAENAMTAAELQLSMPLSAPALQPSLHRLCDRIGYLVDPGH